jgi:hypothetical protein
VKLDGFRNYLYETMNKKFEPFQFFWECVASSGASMVI